jgi:hypothetical protein
MEWKISVFESKELRGDITVMREEGDMPFPTVQDAETRLSNPGELTPPEVRELMPWMRQISEGGMHRLNVEQNLQNLKAIQKFGESSSKLTRWLIALAVVLVILTGVIASYTFVLVKMAHPS